MDLIFFLSMLVMANMSDLFYPLVLGVICPISYVLRLFKYNIFFLIDGWYCYFIRKACLS